jgi:endonuclease/exonuclease/phosphatase family metal-dependent hydrolase
VRRAATVLTIVAALVAAAPAGAAPRTPTDVRVMSFNVWLGGDVVDFGGVVRAIRAADADIVGLQEAEGNTRRIAQAVGWPYWSDRLHVVSRYPLIDPPRAHGQYVLAQVRPGQVFALANEHLPSDPYGPYLVRDGKSLAQVLRNERTTRMPAVRAALRGVRPALAGGIPTLMTGDFNAPSSLDWTPATVGTRNGLRYPVAWPVTRAVAAAGFQDTYRTVHPDPVANPGITWTFGYPFPRLRRNEVVDRIDFVQASRGLQVLDSGIAGPSGTRDVTVPVDPWPSDHRAVVSTVRLTPAVPPLYASVIDRRVERGDPILVRYAAQPGQPRMTLRIVRHGGAADDAVMQLPPQEAGYYGAVRFGSGGLRPGRYDALLVDGGAKVRSRASFWIVAPGARPVVRVPATVTAKRPVRVAWRNAPGDRFDWVGIWKAGDADLFDYSAFAYTRARVAGHTSFAGGLAPGRYVARLLADDGYAVLAQRSFTVLPRR